MRMGWMPWLMPSDSVAPCRRTSASNWQQSMDSPSTVSRARMTAASVAQAPMRPVMKSPVKGFVTLGGLSGKPLRFE